MKPRTTIILALLCAAAFGAYMIDRAYFKSTTQIVARQNHVFSQGIEAGLVQRVEIRRTLGGEESTLVFERRDDEHWDVAQPLADWADSAQVESIISSLDLMKSRSPLAEAESLDGFGLDAPVAEIRLIFAEKTQRLPAVLLIGKPAMSERSAANNVYVKDRDSANVAIVAGTILDTARKPLDDFRSRDVLRFEPHRIDRVKLAMPAETIVCERAGGRWRLIDPVDARADDPAVEGLLEALLDASRMEFIADNVAEPGLAQYGLSAPRATITIRSSKEGNPTHKIAIGGPVRGMVGQFYATTDRTSSVFAVKKDLVDSLTKTHTDLRDRNVLDFSVASPDSIRISTGNSEILLAAGEGEAGWKMISPRDRETDTRAITDLIEAVDELKAADWAAEKAEDLAQFGLNPPAATITMDFAKDAADDPAGKEQRRVELLIGRKDGENCCVKLAGEDPVMLVNASIHDKATRPYLAYLDRRIFNFDRSQATKLTVVRGDETSSCTKDDGEWKLTAPIDAPADRNNVSDILWDMSGLEADQIVAEDEKDFAKYGLDAPAAKITVTTKPQEPDGPAQDHELHLGAADASGNSYARVAGRDVVFTVRATIARSFEKELRELTVLKFAPDDATSLHIQKTGEADIICEKQDNEWILTAPAGKRLDKEAIEFYVNGLNGLAAERYVDDSPGDLSEYGLDTPSLRITVTLQDAERSLLIGESRDDKTSYAKVSGGDGVFILSEFTVRMLSTMLAAQLQ